MAIKATASLGALNAVTPVFTSDGGPFYFSVRGTFVGTLTLQASNDGGTNWYTVRNDANASITMTNAGYGRQVVWDMEVGVQYRVQMTAWTSGSAVVALSA